MDRKELESQAERYKREMMKLYNRSSVSSGANAENNISSAVEANEERNPDLPQIEERPYVPEVNEERNPDSPQIEEEPYIPEANEERNPDSPQIAEQPYIPEANEDNPPEYYNNSEGESTQDNTNNFFMQKNRYDIIYPEPDLSALNRDYSNGLVDDAIPPSYVSEESIGSSRGYIQVNVRTGDDSYAVPDAIVLITATVDGRRMILAAGLTDLSGATRLFEVPVPDILYSQSPDSEVRPYSLFDISVTADGFFNSRSVDVPVFSGITSVQNFNMIPVPAFMKSTDETVTYFNQEPNLWNPKR